MSVTALIRARLQEFVPTPAERRATPPLRGAARMLGAR